MEIESSYMFDAVETMFLDINYNSNSNNNANLINNNNNHYLTPNTLNVITVNKTLGGLSNKPRNSNSNSN